ncbi:mate-domain-containing protein [Phascolomyces articulosus]|uniref:Mate-domain-containing protein n=1 Tax=Phascolomyces articulosus TaxID=60185 RepID=A0AAD5JLS7_9FUNG|nr:mate-domain-containing protein [Phascolomyces articulosus]
MVKTGESSSQITPRESEDVIGANEQSALLSSDNSSSLTTKKDPISHKEHVQWIMHKSIPIVATSLLHQAVKWIVIIVAGHLGSTELGAIAIAHVFENMSTKLVSWSLRSALGTLCSQAWTGAKDKSLVGIYLQRGYVLFGLMCIPIAILWMGSGFIFQWLRQDPDVAYTTQIYLIFQFPGFVAHGCYVLLMAYLQAQGIMRATAYILTLLVPINALTCYILVDLLELGIAGISLSLSINYILTFGLLVLYTAKIEGYEAWGNGWSKACFQDLNSMMNLFWPCSISAIWTIGAQAVLTFSVSYLGKNQLAAQAILLRTSLTLFALGRGFQNALANRVGNFLGDGSPKEAKRSFSVASMLAFVFGILSTFGLMACRHYYPYLFTSDEEVAQAVSDVIPIFALTQTVNMFRALSTGVLQGLGRQKVTATVSFISYFIVYIPLCYVFAFTLDGGLFGLWTGQSIGYLVYTLMQVLYILLKVNWSVESQNAQKRIEANQKKLNSPPASEEDEHYGAITKNTQHSQ